MKRGDIVLVPFPFTNLTDSKRRPALIISGDGLNNTEDIILAQITSNNRLDDFSVSFDNQNDLTTPLNKASEIRCNKIFVASKSIVIRQLSTIKPSVIDKVTQKVCSLLNP
jgi:mRNA interferase MazF